MACLLWGMYVLIIKVMLAIFFLLFLCRSILVSGDCPTFMCGTYGVPIRFPFQLEGHEIQNCGYPGFGLRCNHQSKTVLSLPYSGDFLVRRIDYLAQEIHLYDSGKCLVRRLLQLNLSASPFLAAAYENYTFFSCPTQKVQSPTTIPCLSNSTTSVLAAPSTSPAPSEMSEICTIFATLPIPVPWPFQYAGGFADNLNYDLQLSWYAPDCTECESSGIDCGFQGDTNQEVGCSLGNQKGRSASGLHRLKVTALWIALPIIVFAAGIALFAYLTNRRPQQLGNNARPWNSAAAAAAAVPPHPANMMTGLDESTIESYQKVVLGESKRLPGPNDTTCAICLSEYHAKDTVRCIPECSHCFHADCIDHWLRINSTCPVCRNAPPPSPAPAPAESQSH